MPFAPSILAAARRGMRDLEALLLPAACLGCERALRPADEARAICDGCRARLRPIAPPTCARCGQPLDRWERPAERRRTSEAPGAGRATACGPPARACVRCGFCHSWPAALAWARSAVWLDDGPARALVHALKYGGWRVAARPMALALGSVLAARRTAVDALVPVPLGRRRLRERGHNQAACLAAILSELVEVPLAPRLLARRRETRSQTALDPAARHANVAGAFRAADACAGWRLCLVDDVLTTGATLAACAAALAEAGAGEIGALTFARAPVPA